ncbi:MAG: photosystem II biogenesis protein Psp29 [Spirulinaceae cyanobacterium]
MDKVRTLSDTKRKFYTIHTRPINSIYRRVVEELMVEMHLLSVNVDFRYNPIYALGVVTSFDRFMEGYRPQSDKESIFKALCQAVGDNPENYRQDATSLKALSDKMSGEDLITWLDSPTPIDGLNDIDNQVREVAQNSQFKYSRLFAIGLYTLLEQGNSELLKEQKQRDEFLQKVGEALNLPAEKMLKDLDLYRGNLDKMTQVQAAIEDTLKAGRKQKERRAQEKQAKEEAKNQEDSSPEESSEANEGE